MKFAYINSAVVCAGYLLLGSISHAQEAPATDGQAPSNLTATPPVSGPLPTPSITGPLAGLPPATFTAGPFGTVAVNGVVSGIGAWQGNQALGDNASRATLSDGQVFLQKTDGWLQFYLQVGDYNIPSLGTPFLATDKTLSELWGPVSIGFLKFQATKNTSIEVGSLPTLIGAESTFSFENMNVERGLLWNQEPAISKGIQVNQILGKFTASVSWNDGYYSNRYTWLSGSIAYSDGPHSLAFVAGGNLGQTAYQTFATPVQNNGSLYNIIYTYSKGSWIVQPYVQYTNVPVNHRIGIEGGASTTGGALLLSHTFRHGFSLAGRWEYITSSGRPAQNAINLLYGAGSTGASFTLTPAFQYGGFFVRGDLSWVHASNYEPGNAFGPTGMNANQPRAVAEVGFIFGNNIVEKKP
jgi:hypothetical protein